MKPWQQIRENGHIDAWNEDVDLRVEGKNAKVFMRNKICTVDGHSRVLVGELDGVRLYITDDGMLMTKRDVY